MSDTINDQQQPEMICTFTDKFGNILKHVDFTMAYNHLNISQKIVYPNSLSIYNIKDIKLNIINSIQSAQTIELNRIIQHNKQHQAEMTQRMTWGLGHSQR